MNNWKWYADTYLLMGVPYGVSGIIGCYARTKFARDDGTDQIAFFTAATSTTVFTAIFWPVFMWHEFKQSRRAHPTN